MNEYIFTTFNNDHHNSIIPTASVHGLHRAPERMKVNQSQAISRIVKAWEFGIDADDLTYASQRKYLHQRASRFYTELRTESDYKVYGNNLYIFSDTGCLITMFEMPATSSKHYIGKERFRKFSQYKRRFRELDYADYDYDVM